MELLLLNHAKVESVSSGGTTALMIAAQGGFSHVVLTLLQNGANINRQNMVGMNALMFAALRGHDTIAKVLIHKGALIDSEMIQVFLNTKRLLYLI